MDQVTQDLLAVVQSQQGTITTLTKALQDALTPPPPAPPPGAAGVVPPKPPGR